MFLQELLDKKEIISDIKITVKGSGVNFYFWVNLWYCTLDLIKTHIDEVCQSNNNFYFKEEMDERNRQITSEENQVQSIANNEDEIKQQQNIEEKEDKKDDQSNSKPSK